MTKDTSKTGLPQAEPAPQALWDACGEALGASVKRSRRADAQLREAATRLAFQQIGDRWERECPHCGTVLILRRSGLSYRGGSYCAAIPSLQKWLRDGGYAS